MKKKNQKPIDIDAHLIYRCPKINCGFEHYLSLKEAQTKNFRIVCDCGVVFKPRQIKRLKIIYHQSHKIEEPQQLSQTEKEKEIPVDLQKECVKLLVSYGFTKNESLQLVSKSWALNNTIDSASVLVRHIIQNLGVLNDTN